MVFGVCMVVDPVALVSCIVPDVSRMQDVKVDIEASVLKTRRVKFK